MVDYKTDARPRPEAVRAQYGGQAGAYALAFEAAGGGPVVAVRVLLAALPDAAGAATVVDLPVDQAPARPRRVAPAPRRAVVVAAATWAEAVAPPTRAA